MNFNCLLILSILILLSSLIVLILVIMKTKSKNEMVKLDIKLLNKFKISFENHYDKQD
ncbi:hypothetical protein SD457_05960 [Coprobacillaceae bacterium CR2/5/TPMF4]|nr:hypothetical protein SD457_05960 [Coprobacillaceae bacterium CR2/5/TPMF4]